MHWRVIIQNIDLYIKKKAQPKICFRYTCVYLACKVEEFNVSIQQFVANCHGDKEKAADVILSNELLLMHELQYHLTVHNPYRPLEGLLIDIKVG